MKSSRIVKAPMTELGERIAGLNVSPLARGELEDQHAAYEAAAKVARGPIPSRAAHWKTVATIRKKRLIERIERYEGGV